MVHESIFGYRHAVAAKEFSLSTGNKQTHALSVIALVDEMDIGSKHTGTWFTELAAPYGILTGAGYEVVLASANGGAAPGDWSSHESAAHPQDSQRVMAGEVAQHAAIAAINWRSVNHAPLRRGHFSRWPWRKAPEQHQWGSCSKGIHVVHTRLVGLTWSDKTRLRFGSTQEQRSMPPIGLAAVYWQRFYPPQSTWTQELDLRAQGCSYSTRKGHLS
jgi:hypothetical protein